MADVRAGQLRSVAYETIGAARMLADGGRVAALVVGPGAGALAGQVADRGVDEVLWVEGEAVERYTPDAYLAVLDEALAHFPAQAAVFAHSAIGRDLAPVLAAKRGAGQVSDVTGVVKEGDEILFTRPIYAGKAFATVRVEGDFVVATIRPNNLPAAEKTGSSAMLVPLPAPSAGSLRTVVRDVAERSATGVDLAEAKIVVSGGRGVKSAEGFEPLRELASVLNAAVGASRGACDAGYCDYSLQIGQTGKVVTPDLYIACGISGAIQHLAGMSNAKVIVAINKDPEAPIFKVADYGIVGDLFEVVPALTEEFRRVLGKG